MGKLSAESLNLPGPTAPNSHLKTIGQGRTWVPLDLLSPAHPSPLPPTLTPSQTNCKNCSWSKWSSARSWSENFRVSKVPPSQTQPHPTSWPELSALGPAWFRGPQCKQLPGGSRPGLHSWGFLLGQRLGGWGWGNGAEGGGCA